jgi:hypothetical protein
VTTHRLDAAGEEGGEHFDPDCPSEVQCLALAPLPRHTSPDLSFLLVDAAHDLGTPQARTLLEHFAGTMALVLDAQARRTSAPAAQDPADDWDAEEWDEEDLVGRDTPVADASRVPANRPAPNDPEPDDDVETEARPRPRREIIAEEMEVARHDNRELALVLVHLNRSDVLGEEGGDAVSEGERHLRHYLQECAPECRVTRFGELTFGVFVHEPADVVCDWAVDVHDSFAREDGILHGGASIGVAVWNREDDPSTLRANATEALRESYISGHCTIIE